MKKLTIYNVYVEMQDQAQCDRMKQLCVDNGLTIDIDRRFVFDFKGDYFEFYENEFYVYYYNVKKSNKTKVTEREFIELLKNK